MSQLLFASLMIQTIIVITIVYIQQEQRAHTQMLVRQRAGQVRKVKQLQCMAIALLVSTYGVK